MSLLLGGNSRDQMKRHLAELQNDVLTKKLKKRKQRNPHQWAYRAR
jgi:hypothetical protein